MGNLTANENKSKCEEYLIASLDQLEATLATNNFEKFRIYIQVKIKNHFEKKIFCVDN